jgi:hypothetical protein
MNRKQATRIRIEPWMNTTDFAQVIEDLGIEYSEGDCPQTGYRCLWVMNADERIFKMALGELRIETNLRLWLDDGEQEIRINEHNYKQYDSGLFYKTRSGKYNQNLEDGSI